MEVSDGHVAVLRAMLMADTDEYDRLAAPYEESGGGEGYGELVAAAFIEAVHRRFGKDRLISDLIRYVAAVRARYGDDGDDLDPVVGERLMRVALGESASLTDLDEKARARAQAVLLFELIADEHLDHAGLDDLLAQARARDERMWP